MGNIATPKNQPTNQGSSAAKTDAISSNPNHRNYGPIRRMWIILEQLGLRQAADNCWKGQGWESAMNHYLNNMGEQEAAQFVLYFVLRWADD